MISPGSKYEHILSAGLPIFVAIIGGILTIFAGSIRGMDHQLLLLFISFIFGQCVGLVLIFISKFSNIKKGIYFNFGFSGLERRERFLYVLGYFILILTTSVEIIFAFRKGLM